MDRAKQAEAFGAIFDEIKRLARETFEKEGGHAHVVVLMRPAGDAVLPSPPLPFGQMVEWMPARTRDSKKDLAYRKIHDLILLNGAQGYIDVSEIWMVKMSAEEAGGALRQYQDLRKGYDSLEQVPGRIEALTVTGRWRDKRFSQIWKIGRRKNDGGKDEVWLEEMDGSPDFARPEAISRKAEFDKAVDRVCAGEGE